MALLFNADGDTINTADNAMSGLNVGAFTMFFRYYQVARGASWVTGAIFNIGNSYAWQQDVCRISLDNSASSTPGVRFEHWFATTDALHLTDRDYTSAQWWSVAVSYDRTDPATSPVIYRNGVADTWGITDTNGAGAPQTVDGSTAAPDTFFTATGGVGEGPYYGGQSNTYVCDWAMWNRELSAQEMAAITGGMWSPGHPAFRGGLVLWFPGFKTTDIRERITRSVITHTSTGNIAHPPMGHPAVMPHMGLGVPAAGAPPSNNMPALVQAHGLFVSSGPRTM